MLTSIEATMFYLGYLVFQFQFGYLLQRLPTGRLLSTTVICWGAVLLSSPACTSFAGMATNRFLLGAFESAINPGFVLLMSMWYTTADQPLRLEAYYSTIGIATMFSGLIGYAIGHIRGGLAKWMYIYIIFGSVTVTWVSNTDHCSQISAFPSTVWPLENKSWNALLSVSLTYLVKHY